jgi:hypothetical protein
MSIRVATASDTFLCKRRHSCGMQGKLITPWDPPMGFKSEARAGHLLGFRKQRRAVRALIQQ